MAAQAAELAPPWGESQSQGRVLPHREEIYAVSCSLSSPASIGASNSSHRARSLASETWPSTARSSVYLSDRAAASGCSPTPHKPQKPALSLRSLVPPSSWVLAGLELSDEEMNKPRSARAPLARGPVGLADDNDLALELPASLPVQHDRAPSAITWAASQTQSSDGASHQPWRKFWPPPLGSAWFKEVEVQRSDVLHYSFDRDNHLLHGHHPWQNWKSEPHASAAQLYDEDLDVSESASTVFSGMTPISVSPPRSLSGNSWGTDPGSQAPCSVSRHAVSAAAQRVRDALDDLIQVDLQLPSVTPKQFNYLRPLRRYRYERPYRLQLPPDLVPMPATNVQAKSYHPVRIHDMSGHEDKFTLDVSGFQFLKCPVPVGEWDEKAVAENYLPALLDWVVALLGGDCGLVYSFNFRHHSSSGRFVRVQRPWSRWYNPLSAASAHSMVTYPGNDDKCYSLRRMMDTNKRDDHFVAINEVEADPLGPCHWKQPLFRVHCDASETTHQHRLPLLRPSDADSLMRGRVREVSVWRKLSSQIQDTPLALCDARTVDRQDLVPMDVVYPHFADEVSEVRHNKNHRWFYNKSMTTEDAAIFMLHDTHAKENVCPHSAFVDPSVPGDTPPRLSIEVKIMIFGGDISPKRS